MGGTLSEPVATSSALSALYEISLATARGVAEPAEIARLAVGHAAALLGVEGGACFVWNPRSELLEPIFETASGNREGPCRTGEGMVGIAFGEQRTVAVDDYAAWEPAIPASRSRGMGGAIAVPLVVDGRPIGSLGVWTYHPRHFSEEDGRLLEVFAGQVAPAVAALLQAQARDSQSRIFEVMQAIAATSAGAHDPAILAQVAIEGACRLVGGDAADLRVHAPDDGGLVQLAHFGPGRLRSAPVVAVGSGAVGLCAKRREPVVVTDYPAWPQALAQRLQLGQTSIVAVPLLVGERLLGVISVCSHCDRRFNDADAELLGLLASQVAPALESARLLVESRRQVDQLRALNEVAAAVRGKMEPARLAQITVDRVRELVTADGAFLTLWEAGSDRLVVLAGSEAGPHLAQAMPAAEGAAEAAFRSGEPCLVPDYSSWPGASPAAVASGVKSVLVVPMTVADRRVGTIGVYTRGSRPFTAADTQLMRLVSAQVAPAIETSRLLTEAETRVAGLQALHDLAVAAGGILDAAALAELTVEHARHLLGADGAALRWWDEATRSLERLAFVDYRHLDTEAAVPAGVGVAGLAFERQEPVVVENYESAPEAVSWARTEGVSSALAVPLMVGSRAVGVLVVGTYQPHRFDPEKIRLLQLFAAQVAPAIEAARLSEDRARQSRALLGIHELAAAAGALLDTAEVTRLAQDKACDLLGADSAGLAWWDAGQNRLVFLTDESWRGAPAPTQKPGEGVLGIAFERGEPFQVTDYPAWELAIPEVVAAGQQSVLAVPLRVADRPVGAMVVRSATRRLFSEEEVRLLDVLGAQVGPALEAARLHASLAASESDFRTLFDLMAGGVLIVDGSGTTIDCNQAAATIMECEPGDLIGAYPSEVAGWQRFHVDGSPLPAAQTPAMMALVSRRPVRNQLVRLRKDRTEKWLQFDAIPILDPAGGVDKVIVTFLDVSGVKEAEIARKENEAKDRFLAAMSHELRTPLNSVLGFGQLLQDPTLGELSERHSRYVHNIISSGRHLLELVNDVLDLSRVAAGQMDVQAEDFELRPLLEEAVTRIRPLADAKGIELGLQAEGSQVARADRRRLDQVVWNLLSNAIKFTPDGGAVTISAGATDSAVTIQVRDNGIGIAADQHELIFMEFTQVENGRDRAHQGTGLGLALSRKLVTAMGGTITVASTPGAGSTFTVELPRLTKS